MKIISDGKSLIINRGEAIECLQMAFGSHKGAESSTVYHTFIATCKMSALSFRQFLKNYFTAFMEGRTDFENLTPAILGKSN